MTFVAQGTMLVLLAWAVPMVASEEPSCAAMGGGCADDGSDESAHLQVVSHHESAGTQSMQVAATTSTEGSCTPHDWSEINNVSFKKTMGGCVKMATVQDLRVSVEWVFAPFLFTDCLLWKTRMSNQYETKNGFSTPCVDCFKDWAMYGHDNCQKACKQSHSSQGCVDCRGKYKPTVAKCVGAGGTLPDWDKGGDQAPVDQVGANLGARPRRRNNR